MNVIVELYHELVDNLKLIKEISKFSLRKPRANDLAVISYYRVATVTLKSCFSEATEETKFGVGAISQQ